MFQVFRLALIVSSLALGLVQPRQAQPLVGDAGPEGKEESAQLTDRFGDPLPRSAIARLGTTRWYHSFWVSAIAFSPDGKLLASAALDQSVRLWDRATGREVRSFILGRDK